MLCSKAEREKEREQGSEGTITIFFLCVYSRIPVTHASSENNFAKALY